MAVKVTARVSAAGSARYTEVVFSKGRIPGSRYIIGISRTNYRTTATAMDSTALPRALKVIWQAIWIPKRNMTPM